VAEAIELVVTELSDSRETADVPKRLRDSVLWNSPFLNSGRCGSRCSAPPDEQLQPLDLVRRHCGAHGIAVAGERRTHVPVESRRLEPDLVSYVAIALPTFANGRSTDWFASGPNTDSCRCPRPERLRPEAVPPPVPEEPCLVCGTDDGHRPTRRETNSLCQPPAVQITVLTSLPPLRGVS
jgi:hypothetical protein